MKRRAFLAAISALPLLGWLKPAPEPEVALFSNAHTTNVSLDSPFKELVERADRDLAAEACELVWPDPPFKQNYLSGRKT